jgi:nicotinate phosphoribosyltransferase
MHSTVEVTISMQTTHAKFAMQRLRILTSLFFKDFDHTLAQAYAGVRHDSGDPFVFADTVSRNYSSLGINVHDKLMVFSDSLDVDKCIDIKRHVDSLGGVCMFGIGYFSFQS